MSHRAVGRWRIVEMDQWDDDVTDLVAPGQLELEVDGTGWFSFAVVEGNIDWKPADGRAGRAEFSWEGMDECDPATGRGWVERADNGDLRGHIYFHHGDDSGFRAIPGNSDPTSP